ncbi:glycosyltransferase involved in cell wall biosynthesis [Marinobacter sp. LV10R520-4]|nr:glycosyltransferase involved in cell wall biosynthesis [Marinobacter sp. LV10R520-4]
MTYLFGFNMKSISLFFDGPQMGGIGARNIDLANEFIRQGYRVTLLMLTMDGPRKNQLPKAAIIKEIGLVGSIGIIRFLIDHFKKDKPDFVIVSNVMPGAIASIAKSLARGHFGLGVINRVDFERVSESYKTTLKGRVLYFIAPLFLRKYAKLIALSHAARQGLAKYSKCALADIAVINDPIRLNDEVSGDFEKEILKWWCASGIKILSVGRLDKLKNIESIIVAVKHLLDLDPKLLIVGGGPEKESLEKLVERYGLQENVLFCGYVQAPAVFFKNSDFFISASLSEAFPNSVVEAVCAGCQVVSADCNYGPREILGDDEYGKLVPLKDPKAIAQAVRYLHKNPVPAQKLLARSKEYDPEFIANNIINILK